MNHISALPPAALYRRCDPEQLAFDTTAELAELSGIIGQTRAVSAMEFGVGIKRDGYNLFVLGPPGSGKHTLLSGYLEAKAAQQAQPPDWCYVNNFEQPHKPRAVMLPPGRGAKLRTDMQQFVDELRAVIPATFESDEYRARAEQIDTEFRERESNALEELGRDAAQQNVALLRTPAGFSFAPAKGDEVMSPEDYAKLSAAEQERIGNTINSLQQRLETVIRQLHRWHKERREKLRALNKEMISFAVGHLTDELKEQYTDLPAVLQYMDAMRSDVIEHAEEFRKPAEGPLAALGLASAEAANFRRYQVNLLVDHSQHQSAPVISEQHPIYQNLVGRVEHATHLGTLVTDFTLIKPGALHLANGGYLLLDVYKLFAQPFAWDGLKRALASGTIKIESLGQMYSLVSTVSLEPEPIPLNLKVVLFGDRYAYYLLSAHDPDFSKLFKVAADFEDSIARDAENSLLYARMVGSIARKDALLPFERGAVARVIEWCARHAEDAEKLSTHLQSVVDLLHEADYWARRTGHARVSAPDVAHAIDTKIHRLDRLRERVHEAILRDVVLIDTEGATVGQVNALSVVMLSNFAFAYPTRITATTRLGDGQIIDIQRETALGGSLHSKGVLTLAAFLATRYSRQQPLSMSASLTFEQTYSEVEGDSASVAELCALLSSLSDVPIKQSLAVTGSVNQLGQVQAIGGVNEKIEGFFDVCAKRGLTGEQGVLIPAANVKHLMLREDVVAAVAADKFRVYPVRSVDEAIELLTGVEAGTADVSSRLPAESINARVAARLRQLSARQRELASVEKRKPAHRRPHERRP